MDQADERGAGAIVIASHGHGGVTRLMIGSVAQRVAQQSLVPTMIVRTGASQPDRVSFRKILVPLDGSMLAESALELVTDVAGQECEITLARVVEPVRGALGGSAELGTVVNWQATQEATNEAEKYLTTKAHALERAGLTARSVVCTGEPEEELRRIASEKMVDVIVMATHGRAGLSRFLLGSTTDTMIRQAAQPVLLINARALSARMLVPYSVRDVLRRDVTTLHPGESLRVAMTKLLRRRETGAAVIDGDRALLGFVSERDFLQWHASYMEKTGQDEGLLDPVRYCEEMERLPVTSIMSAPAIAVESDAPLAAAAHMFMDHSFQSLPVTSNGRFVGAVDRSDILRALNVRDAQLAAAANDQ
jgi:nucleotide-binding universal stress UspA family protein